MTTKTISSLFDITHDRPSELVLWERYWKYGNEDCRNALVDFYSHFVRAIAFNLFRKNRHTGIHLEDCIQYGFLGLLDAIPRYRNLQQAKFSTYASYRVKGEIYAGINRYYEYNSVLKYKKENEEERIASIQVYNATTHNGYLSTLIDTTADIAVSIYLDEFDERLSERNSKSSIGDINQLIGQLNFIGMIDALSGVHQEIIRSHYFYECSFSEIAKIHGVSKARISQLHGESIAQLRVLFVSHKNS